ncbi:MAG TPA: hypothetical protein DEF51_28670 [Myxococcales bacterium]|nr:hypothetical protein [Myxococcales bacterium]
MSVKRSFAVTDAWMGPEPKPHSHGTCWNVTPRTLAVSSVEGNSGTSPRCTHWSSGRTAMAVASIAGRVPPKKP